MKNNTIKSGPSGNNENERNYNYKGKTDDFRLKSMYEIMFKMFVVPSGRIVKKAR